MVTPGCQRFQGPGCPRPAPAAGGRRHKTVARSRLMDFKFNVVLVMIHCILDSDQSTHWPGPSAVHTVTVYQARPLAV